MSSIGQIASTCDRFWRIESEDSEDSKASYYRARYYDPQAVRFVSEDPMRWNAAQNFYEYVNNNSTNASDPLGLIACKDCRKFLRYCYLTAGAAGFMGRWGCRTVCISVLKMPLTCWTVCTAAGAATAGALQVACYAGYQKCLKNCDQAPNVCSSGAPSGQTGSDFAGQNPQTSGPSGPVGGGGGGTIPW
jgi:RHS repeat-associated protein